MKKTKIAIATVLSSIVLRGCAGSTKVIYKPAEMQAVDKHIIGTGQEDS